MVLLELTVESVIGNMNMHAIAIASELVLDSNRFGKPTSDILKPRINAPPLIIAIIQCDEGATRKERRGAYALSAATRPATPQGAENPFLACLLPTDRRRRITPTLEAARAHVALLIEWEIIRSITGLGCLLAVSFRLLTYTG